MEKKINHEKRNKFLIFFHVKNYFLRSKSQRVPWMLAFARERDL